MENTSKPKNRALLFIVVLLVVAVAALLFTRGTEQGKEAQTPAAPQMAPAQAAGSPAGIQPSNPMTIMQAAIASGDPAKCEELKVEQMKVFCQVSTALKSGDTSICERVSSTRTFPFKSPMTGYSGNLSASDFCWMQAIRRTRQDLCGKVSEAVAGECRKEFEAISKRGPRGMPPMGGMPPAGAPERPEIPRQSLMPDTQK